MKKITILLSVLFSVFLLTGCGEKKERDTNVEENEPSKGATTNFLLAVGDVYSISGRGVVITGRVESGEVHIGDTVELLGMDEKTITTTVERIEMFHNDQESAKEGDNIGIILKDITKEQVKIGQVITSPHRLKVTKRFNAEVSFLEESGREVALTHSTNTKVYFRTVYLDWDFTFPKGIVELKPGETVELTITLASSIGMDVGNEFLLREGGRTFAKGVVTKIVEEQT